MPDTMSLEQEIAALYMRFKAICAETSTIVDGNPMPDATLQLQDVIAGSETAATTILECANAISGLSQSAEVPKTVQAAIGEQVLKIYEASSFQDIGAQRIKKVLKGLQTLDAQLEKLARHAGHATASKKRQEQPAADGDRLLNGPQLQGEVPSQQNIDALFGS